jgi:hypothetical protein
MPLPITASAGLPATAPQKPTLSATVEHMTGMLWYQMLSAMNENGNAPGALGTGGDDFQGMFLWNMAQNDFGKYDSSLLKATMRQVGGTDSQAPAAAPVAPSPLAQPSGTAASARHPGKEFRQIRLAASHPGSAGPGRARRGRAGANRAGNRLGCGGSRQ